MILRFTVIVLMILSGPGIPGALENVAYVPHYRLQPVNGAENALGRPSWDARANAWDGRLIADTDRAYGLPAHWSEGSWIRRLGARYDRVIFHTDMASFPFDGPERRSVTILKRLIRPGGLRVFFSILGVSRDFLPHLKSEESLAEFCDLFVEIARREGLDGIDIDWEFIGMPKSRELEGLGRLAEALRAALPREITLSTAVSPSRPPERRFFDSIDEVFIMSYDHRGRHATLEAAVADTENIISRFELDPSRVYLGIPWYGRNDDADSPSYWREARNYRDIVIQYDPEPGDNQAGPFYFNGIEMIRAKIDFAGERELGGVFVWEPFYDINGPMSLGRAAARALDSPELP